MTISSSQAYSIASTAKGHWLLGVIPELKKGPFDFFLNIIMQENADLIPMQIGFSNYILVTNPGLVEEILVKQHKKFQKNIQQLRINEIIGDNLLTMPGGSKWVQHRQIIQPSFDKKAIENHYTQNVYKALEQTRRLWTASAKDGKPVNITKEMSYVTMQVILASMFGQTLDRKQFQPIYESIHILLEYAGTARPFPQINTHKIFRPAFHKKAMSAVALLQRFSQKLIADLKGSADEGYFFLADLVRYQKKDESFTDEDVQNEALIMLFAGFETTALLIQWTWYALSKEPQLMADLQQELDTRLGKSNNFQAIDEITLLDCIIKETARLYPPFHSFSRVPNTEVSLGNQHFGPNDNFILSPYAMHHHPDYWEHPEAFIHQRFLPEYAKTITEGMYFPFSLGPRRCIGQRFAMMETKIVLAELLRDFSVSLAPGQKSGFKSLVSLRPIQDILMKVELR